MKKLDMKLNAILMIIAFSLIHYGIVDTGTKSNIDFVCFMVIICLLAIFYNPDKDGEDE